MQHPTLSVLLSSLVTLTACDASPSSWRQSASARRTGRFHPVVPVEARVQIPADGGDPVVVVMGRLLHSRLEMRGAEVVLVPPRPGIPVLDESGSIHRALVGHLDDLGLPPEEIAKHGLDGVPAGVVEIELTVSPEVPEEARARFLAFLEQRRIAVVAPDTMRSH